MPHSRRLVTPAGCRIISCHPLPHLPLPSLPSHCHCTVHCHLSPLMLHHHCTVTLPPLLLPSLSLSPPRCQCRRASAANAPLLSFHSQAAAAKVVALSPRRHRRRHRRRHHAAAVAKLLLLPPPPRQTGTTALLPLPSPPRTSYYKNNHDLSCVGISMTITSSIFAI